MRIRLGGYPIVPGYKDRIPNNQGMPDHVEQEIDYIVNSANQSYINALETDGVEFMLWRKTREGRRCTCKHANTETTNIDSRVSEFNATPTKSGGIKVRSSWDRQEVKPNIHGKELGVEIGLIDPEDGSGKQQVKKYPSIDKEEIDAFLNNPLSNRLLNSGEGTTACGICFSTGYTNGFSLYHGDRVTFDTLNTSRISGFSIDSSERPYVFRTNAEQKGQYVEFEWETPNNFNKVLAVLVRDNLSPASGFTLLVEDADEFVPLTKEYLNGLKNNSRRIKFRVVTNYTKSVKLSFTHVEFTYLYTNLDKTQIGQLSTAVNYSTPESTSTTEINLPPSIDFVDNEDIIYEMKYHKIYTITDITDLKTSKHRVMNWTAQCRSLSSFEVKSLLKISMQPNYGLSYNGLNIDE